MSQPPDFDTLRRNRNLPPKPTAEERYRIHKSVAHMKAGLRGQPCPIPAHHRCPACCQEPFQYDTAHRGPCKATMDCPGGCLGQGMTYRNDDYEPCMGAQ